MTTDYMYEYLRRDYESVRETYPDAGLKPYEDLTDEERAKHEASAKQRDEYMNDLGKVIRGEQCLKDFTDSHLPRR